MRRPSKRQIGACALVLALALHGGLARGNPADLLAETLAPLQTLNARFLQETRSSAGDTSDTSRGQLWLSRPDSFRIEIEGDYPESIVSDGESWWVYESDLMQVVVRDLAEYADQIPVLVLTSRPELLFERYDIDYYDADEGRRTFVLTPRDGGQMYASISMEFESAEPRALEVRSQVGETTRIRFASVEVNPKFADGTFTFDAPAGVDVIDERGNPPAGE